MNDTNKNIFFNGDDTEHGKPKSLLLRFSHNIIEHLGLKLYQNKPTNVLAELVSNSWDADATRVWVDLINTPEGTPVSISVADNGTGMDETTLTERYLVVGKPKRTPGKPDELSLNGRYLMGRKGIGKLAPFGVARVIHLLTAKNGLLTWLRFDYDKMLEASHEKTSLSTYAPDIYCREANFNEVPLERVLEDTSIVEKFLKNIAATGNGTLIFAHKLTLRRPIRPENIIESLGRRFTVTLARPDFVVMVNEIHVSEADVFPKWELRIPEETGYKETTVKTPLGEKTIRYWAGFVETASWPSEQAGVGVYAHGKIAQDRPYFFEVKGNEVFSRYLYAVVEADWIDELPNDAISTDRTSIDWQDEAFDDLKKWGEAAVKEWIRAYEKHRKSDPKGENRALVETISQTNANLNLRETEKEHLLTLLNEVTPRLSKDPEPKAKFVEATMKAWVHDPARRLIKKLWDEAALAAPEHFALTVTRLADQLVPESLSLAVVFAQRVYALHKLQDRILHGKETDLQALIEEFPWILNSNYEKYFARRELKTICDDAEASGKFEIRPVHTGGNPSTQHTKPDFVFLSSAEDKDILVVELKSPSETAAWPEAEQLNSYVTFLASRFSSSIIDGILVARDFAPTLERHRPQSITHCKWEDILLKSRRTYMELLASLLAGSEADHRDSRVVQICELGGEPVRQFLDDMSSRDPALKKIVSKLNPK